MCVCLHAIEREIERKCVRGTGKGWGECVCLYVCVCVLGDVGDVCACVGVCVFVCERER